jgi:DNA replication and repair protein RecF
MASELYLQSIRLTHFKSYSTGQFEFLPGFNCVVGWNGVGKTNLLDAIHFLCLTKSHRGLPDKNLIQHGASFLRMEAQFQVQDQLHKLIVKLPSDKRKELELDGVVIERMLDHVGRFPAVMIAPDDVSLVQEGSEERRKYLDATLSQLSIPYLQHLVVYNNLLKQRNALLKSFAEKRRFEPLLLEAIDQQLPSHAIFLHRARVEMVAEISPLLSNFYAAISGHREVAAVHLDTDWPEDGIYEAALASHLERDRAMERSTFGPHRDDLQLLLDGLPLKKYASQGQMKSYLLAMRLAQYEYLREAGGKSPILLLDDIFDKLDAQRVQQLVGLLLERKVGQVFITDTHQDRVEAAVAAAGVPFKTFSIV